MSESYIIGPVVRASGVEERCSRRRDPSRSEPQRYMIVAGGVPALFSSQKNLHSTRHIESSDTHIEH